MTPALRTHRGELQPMQMLQALMAQMQALGLDGKPLPQWLTLKQAADYTGLSKPLLLRAIGVKKLVAVKDGRWKIRRTSLDNLDDLAAIGTALNAVTSDIRQTRQERRKVAE